MKARTEASLGQHICDLTVLQVQPQRTPVALGPVRIEVAQHSEPPPILQGACSQQVTEHAGSVAEEHHRLADLEDQYEGLGEGYGEEVCTCLVLSTCRWNREPLPG